MEALLNEIENINARISELLAGEYTDDRRLTITLAYLNIGLDHHSAITFLMRNKRFGSALALVRSVFEAMLRAHWVVGCATNDEVDQLATDHDFDIMSRVDVDRIDKAFQANGFFRQAKTDAWKAMNAYTHSGLRQLVRQFTAHHVEAKYKDEELVDGLRAATASILMLGYLLASFTARTAEATEIEKLFQFG